jgi:hypothetical protein
MTTTVYQRDGYTLLFRPPAERPTREQWDAAKLSAPEPLRTLYAEAIDREAEAAQLRDRNWSDAERRLLAHRAGFEKALGELLDREGGAWLGYHRAPDELIAGPHRLSLNHRIWLAAFDLRPFGFHVLRVELAASLGDDGWAAAYQPFGVDRSAGTRWCRTLAEAIRVAGEYESCPF